MKQLTFVVDLDRCIGCKGCEGRCPFGVKIMEHMEKAQAIFGA